MRCNAHSAENGELWLVVLFYILLNVVFHRLKNKLCLRKHKLQHSDVRLNCDRCEYSASSQQCLRNHQKVQHSDDKPFSCHVNADSNVVIIMF